MTETVRIAMWSGPRNISTAMMRAWDSRADTAVMDEPFYGAYLATTGLDHPMRDEIIAHHETDWDAIARTCAGTDTAPIVYQKHMSQHMIEGAPLGWMRHVRHAFLLRSPAEVAASFRQKWDGMSAEDLGFRRQAELFDHACQIAGAAPPVLLARDVLADPEGMLRALCTALGVAFDPAMLSWQPGARATDGIWASHWYNAVNRSTGFAPPRAEAVPPEGLDAVIEACEPYHARLLEHRLTAA